MLKFVTRTPAVPNLGDILCCPRNYFEIRVAQPTAIIGGGAFSDFGFQEAGRLQDETKITWAIGRSIPFGTTRSLDRAWVAQTYRMASIRDHDLAGNGIEFVPCPSVLHSIVEIAPGHRRGLFLNASPKASGSAVGDILKSAAKNYPDLVIATNAANAEDFINAFAQTAELITNSFHAAYWALLSGRSITLLGYSSKFTSLLASLGLQENAVVRYERGSGEQLASRINEALAGPAIIKLPDAEGIRDEFRGINLAYARRLVSEGVVLSAERIQ